MKEACKSYEQARVIEPHLKKCPGKEIPVIRPLSGHGGKVCEPCSNTNRNAQRKRENAQKRARRAKLKRDKKTAGIGAGNVVWTVPNTWVASVVDPQTLALHSPQPRRFNTSSVRSMTHALQYKLNSSFGTATIAQDPVDVSLDELGVYSPYRELFAASVVSDVVQPQENGHDRIATEICDDADWHHQYKTSPQELQPTILEPSLYHKQQRQQVGLGIAMANDAKWVQSDSETCSLKEWSFRMELNNWSTVFEDDDDPDDAKEL